MNYYLNVGISMLIGVAAILAIIKWRRISEAYHPFLVLLCAGFINEITSVLAIKYYYTNVVNYNIYLLFEMWLVLLFFKKMNMFQQRTWLFRLLLFLTTTWWVVEILFIKSIFTFNHYTIILYSFITLVLASSYVVYLIFYETSRLLQEARFLINLGLAVFAAVSLLIESIYLYALGLSSSFRLELQYLQSYANLFTNIIFIIAVIWIPTKRRYILRLQ